MRNRVATLLILVGLFALPLILFWPVTLGGKTLLPADVPFQFAPWRLAANELGAAIPQNQLLADLILENYPWKRFILESLRAGEVPLWNPYLFAGAPFLANGQASTLYPFSAIFYVAPLASAYGWFTVTQLFLAGTFMYTLGRVLGIGRLGSLCAAVTYQLSGFFVVSVVFTMIIAAAAWLPLLLAMIECVIRQRPLFDRPASLPWVVIGALALGCQVLAGHPEITYYTLLVMAFFALWRLSSQRTDQPTSQPANKLFSRLVGWLVKVRRPLAALAVMVALGIGLGAVQLLPLGEVVTQNFREDAATFEQVQGWAWPPRHVLKLLMPNVYGNPAHHTIFDVFTWQNVPLTTNLHGEVNPNGAYSTHWGIKNYVEGGAYLGILPLLLALFATATAVRRKTNDEGRRFVVRHSSFVWCFTTLALLSLAFAFGTPLYALLFYGLPGIDQLHSPFRWVWPFTLCVAVLAGFGVEYLKQPPGQRAHGDVKELASRQLIRLFKRVVFLDAPVSLRTLLAGFAFWSGAILFVGLLVSRFVVPIQSLAFADRLLRSLALADTAFPDAALFYSYEWRNLLLLALFTMSGGIVLRVSLCPIYLFTNYLSTQPGRFHRLQGSAPAVPIWKPLALGVLALDLLVAGWGFNPAVDPSLLDYTPPVVEFLKRDTSLWRFTTFDPNGLKTFNANVGWYYNFQDVRGYDSVILKQYADYMRVIDRQDELEFNRIAPLRTYGGLDSPMLDLLGVKYVLTDASVPIDSPKYQLVYDDAQVKVYENLGVMPRAFAQTCAIGVADQFEALKRVDPRTTAILDADAPIQNPASCNLLPADVTKYSANEVFVDVALDQPAWLILNDTYFVGWQAWDRVDGSGPETELAIRRANGNFRAVHLDAGRHTVRFKYSPWSFKLGAFTAFMAGVLIVFMVGLWLWRLAYHEEAVAGSTVRRVAKNSIAPMLLNLFNRAIDFAFAALMLRILRPENAGNFTVAVVIAGWFEILTNFGLNTLLTREVSKNRGQANHFLVNTSILRLMLAGVSMPLVLLLLLVWSIAPGLISAAMLTWDTALAIILLVIAQVPSSLSYGLTALFYAYEKAEYPAVISVITVMLKVALGVPALLLGWGIIGLAAVSVVVNLLTLIILARLSFRMFFRPRLESDPALRRVMVRESFPLMINHLLATLFFKVDIPILYSIQGSTVVGLYGAAYKWVDALNIIPAYSTIALFPVMSRQADEDKAALLRSYRIGIKLLVALALPLAVVTTFVAPALMLVLGGNEYLPHSAIALQIMIWSIPFGWINSITNYVLIALGQQTKLTRAFALGLAFNIVANLILIPRYSYVAAAAITILSELVEGLPFYYFVERSLGPVAWIRMLWKLFASAALMFGAMWALWPVNGVLAIAIGLATYGAGVWGLRVFGPEERAVFAKLRMSREAESVQPVETAV
ncbi:MAG TPA: oligosaccharide flippase family protein [Anaerolineae bacterium]|nr:oligosaccharide flippase family protein [Anaerolineae bacterium]